MKNAEQKATAELPDWFETEEHIETEYELQVSTQGTGSVEASMHREEYLQIKAFLAKLRGFKPKQIEQIFINEGYGPNSAAFLVVMSTAQPIPIKPVASASQSEAEELGSAA